MSRVDASSTSEILTQLKEQYSTREKESEAKHKEDIRDLREVQKSEMEKVRAEAQKRIDNVQEESNLKLSQKDLDHQKEIDAIKAIYAKRAAEGRKPVEDS